MLGREFIGIEREAAYRKVAEKRIASVRKFDKEALTVSASKRAEPRVPFGQLVERGMLRPGEELYSMNKRHKAKVRADGTLIGDDIKGFHPSGGCPSGGRAQLQRLDLLVLQTRGQGCAHRRAAPADPVRNARLIARLLPTPPGACGLYPRP